MLLKIYEIRAHCHAYKGAMHVDAWKHALMHFHNLYLQKKNVYISIQCAFHLKPSIDTTFARSNLNRIEKK